MTTTTPRSTQPVTPGQSGRAVPPTSPQAAGLDPVALGRLTAAVRRDIESGLHFGATILIARSGVVGYHEAIGLADPSTGRPSRHDDLYFLMSLTKSITALAVLQMVDRGFLSLDTRIADVIPEYAQRGKQRVTVYHLPHGRLALFPDCGGVG
jgi:CubicO group peptidase (beta-lactamase class C family)